VPELAGLGSPFATLCADLVPSSLKLFRYAAACQFACQTLCKAGHATRKRAQARL